MRSIVLVALLGCINGCPGTCCTEMPSTAAQKPPLESPPPEPAPAHGNR